MGEQSDMVLQNLPHESTPTPGSEVEREPTLTPESEHTLAQEPEPTQTPSLEPELEPDPLPQPQPQLQPAEPETQPQPQTNLPCGDLLSDTRRRDFITLCVPLYQASKKGDWAAAYAILEVHQHLVRYAITENYETPLHVAASVQRNTKTTKFVENLVRMMEPNDLLLKNQSGETALSSAAMAGNVEIAKIMVQKNDSLPTIPNANGMMPLYLGALFRNLDMVIYLYEISEQMNGPGWTPTYRNWVFTKCVDADFFDFALTILREHPQVDQQGIALGALARKAYAFKETKPHIIRRIINSITRCKIGPAAHESKALILLREIWRNILGKPKHVIDRILRGPEKVDNDGNRTGKHPSRILFVAAEKGNTNFLVELLSSYPDLIWKKNDEQQSIFHVAVSNRHESIYNLLHETGSMKSIIIPMKDRQGNNMLHLVGKIASKSCLQAVSGVAFQMQRELLWLKEVESMIPPLYTERRNNDGLTPHELFAETHSALVSDGEKWMKGTASKCMVVAALVATIVFGVAYTIPGGYSQNDGFPMFRHNVPFIVFVMLDAISFILSSISILVFLSILTSRYAQEDFIESLPKKLMVGLTLLFLSIVTMMIAFSVSFFVLYDHKLYLIVAGSISLLALVPIISYGLLHFPLLKDMFHSAYGSRSLFKPKKQMLYYRNPSF